MVRAPACHAGSCGFESRQSRSSRLVYKSIWQLYIAPKDLTFVTSIDLFEGPPLSLFSFVHFVNKVRACKMMAK